MKIVSRDCLFCSDINASVIPEYASYLARNQINGVYGNLLLQNKSLFIYIFCILVNGTTGEGMYSLTFDERKRIAEGWLSEKSKIPTVIIQVGGCSFREAQQLVWLSSMSRLLWLHIFSGCTCWTTWCNCHWHLGVNVCFSKKHWWASGMGSKDCRGCAKHSLSVLSHPQIHSS